MRAVGQLDSESIVNHSVDIKKVRAVGRLDIKKCGHPKQSENGVRSICIETSFLDYPPADKSLRPSEATEIISARETTSNNSEQKVSLKDNECLYRLLARTDLRIIGAKELSIIPKEMVSLAPPRRQYNTGQKV
jgi:hypothetical protein